MKATYPIPVSLSLIAAAVILSFVDLMFLNDVIGKVLDLGTTESMLIAFALGMVGIGIMAHQGVKASHGGSSLWSSIGHYSLWVFLGIAFVVIRFFSASIMQLGDETGDQALISLLGMDVREVDLVIAPLMMLLYLATGVMAKDGVKHLLLNPDFDAWREERKQLKLSRRAEESKRETKARLAREKQLKEAEEARKKAEENAKKQAGELKLAKTYGQALKNYNEKLNEIKSHYQKISTNIDYVRTIDKQEHQFETSIKPSLVKIIDSSVEAAQNSVALAIRAKSGNDTQDLRSTIEAHNVARR